MPSRSPARLLGRSFAVILLAAIGLPSAASADTVPVEISSGPSFFNLDQSPLTRDRGALADDQPWHFGWRLEMAAIIDSEWAKDHPEYVPPERRRQLRRVENVRYSPMYLALIPRSLLISPKIWNTGIYGATWEILHLGGSVQIGDVDIGLGAGLLLTYAYVDSETLSSPYYFLRPGSDIGLSVRVPLSDKVALSAGWDVHMYLPQKVGGGVFEIAKNGGNLWHISEPYLLVHYRFPY
ncbi:MAG: hypothetical protein ABEN55_08585, partial [Bradymonadaceae bacterium]